MDFLHYIQKLQSELTALNLPKEKVHAIITQESALAETQEASALQSFFTLDRLQTIVSTAAESPNTPAQENETATIAPRVFSQSHASAIVDEEKTILPPSSKATLQSLTDEATMIVISGNSNEALEEKTVAASPDLKKILAENETVRISEKDTVFFKDQPDATLILPKEDETVPHIPTINLTNSSLDEEATLPAYKAIPKATAPDADRTQPMPTGTFDLKKEREEKPTVTVAPEKTPPKTEAKSPSVPLSPEAIRNPHPHISFLWIVCLLIPSICFIALAIAVFILLVDFLFLIAFTAVMLFYLSFLLGPLFLALYSAVFAFLYWQDLRIADGFTEFGLMLFSFGLSLLFGYLLYRPFITLAELIGEKCKSFNQKTFRLLRNLYRYSVKGAEKI